METTEILRESFLFSEIANNTLLKILNDFPPKVISFKRGELVYSSFGDAMVGFILSGRCEIRLDRKNNKTVLNVLGEKDSFGILSVYSAEEYPTKIYATKNSRVLFFTADQIHAIANSSSQISSNIIKFLANRISFLNRKIATFSATTVEERLAAFLLTERKKHSSDQFPFNAQKTSEEINAGRASVYRAIASLEAEGLFSLVDKKIYINDTLGLERITK